MKKKIIIITVIALLGIAGAGAFFLTRPLSLNMEQVFPSEALMYARLSHVMPDVDQLTQSVFWKNVSTIDLPKVLEHNSAPAADVLKVRNMQESMQLFFNRPLTNKFLGKEVAIGFYEENSVGAQKSIKSYDAIFATRLGATLQIAELFVSMANQWTDDITMTTETYHAFKIIHVHFKKRKLDLQYTRIHDILFTSFSQSSLLHQVLDIYQKKRMSLAMDPDFSKSIAHAYPKGHGIFYVNIRGFYELFKKHLPQAQKENFEQMSDATTGFKSYTISFLPGDISKMKLIMHFDPLHLNHYWHSLLSCPEATNPSLKFVPHNVVVYQWGQCYDFKDIRSSVKQDSHSSLKTNQGIEKWQHRLEKRFKLNIRKDVLPLLGSQVGGYLFDVDTQGLFPYPRGVMFVQIKDPVAAKNLMQQLSKNSLALVQQEEYKQAAIHYITLNLGANMDPGYTLLGDYLLLGSSRQLLRASIDAFSNPNQSLQTDETLKEFNIGSSQVSQGMAFIKIDDVASRLQQLLDWYNKTVSSRITVAMAYLQESGGHTKELEEAMASKKEELNLAQHKLKELQLRMTAPELSAQDQPDLQASIDHLTVQVKLLREDLDTYHQQQQELKQTFMNYRNQSDSAKLWLFNSDEVFMPLLKGLEGFNAWGLQFHLGDQISETEISIK